MGSLFSPKPDTSKQDKMLKEQERKEKLRLQEEDSEVNRRKAMASSKSAGRSLLIKTSEAGTKGAKLGV